MKNSLIDPKTKQLCGKTLSLGNMLALFVVRVKEYEEKL